MKQRTKATAVNSANQESCWEVLQPLGQTGAWRLTSVPKLPSQCEKLPIVCTSFHLHMNTHTH